MGVIQRLVNFDHVIKHSSDPLVVINDLKQTTDSDRAALNRLISTTYENTDFFSNEPSCECGTLRGGWMLNVVCPECQHPVLENFDQDLRPLVWMRSPHGVAKLINPMVWLMLSETFTKGKSKSDPGFNMIEWLCNTDYHIGDRRGQIAEINEANIMGMQRGYNNFVTHFDEYIEMLYSMSGFSKAKKGKETDLQVLLREQRDCLFSDYLPLPNKSLLIIEDTQVGTFVDPILTVATDAILTIASVDDPLMGLTVRQKENRTAKTLAKMSNFYFEVYRSVFAGKPGLFRKNVLGTRNDFSTRSVISSRTKAHRYDELEMSWGQAVTMLKLHLQSGLFKQGFTPNESQGYLQKHTYTYSKRIDELFKQMIDQNPEKAFIGTYCRNPSLGRGSVQRLKVTQIKTDPADPTTGLSIINVNQYNADFDGNVCCRKTSLIAGNP